MSRESLLHRLQACARKYPDFPEAGLWLDDIDAIEAASPATLDVRWLADELGMHQFVNDRQCDCGDWDAFRDRGTFNDHVATEVVAALARLTEQEDRP